MSAPTILFVCTHNAGRSALGAALARARGGNSIIAESAGIDPDDGPSPATIATLAELGIDDSGHLPTKLTADHIRAADVVVAMKPGLDLPRFDNVRYETWGLPDPGSWTVENLRALRDDIDLRVQKLIADVR